MRRLDRFRARTALRQSLPEAIRPLARANRMRLIYDAWAATGSFTDADIDRLCAIVCRSWARFRDRRAAAWLLGLVSEHRHMAPAEAALLNAVLPTARDWWIGGSRLSYVGCCIGLVPVVLPVSIILAALARAEDRVRTMAAGSLTAIVSVRGVAVLAAVARDSNRAVAMAARVALLTVLSALTPEHIGTLTPECVDNLAKLLDVHSPAWSPCGPRADRPVHPAELRLAVLRGLEAAGTGRAVPRLEEFIERCTDETERAAAARALAALRRRSVIATQATTLLRPSPEPMDPSKVLVRPAQSGALGDTAGLVRSAQAPDDPCAVQRSDTAVADGATSEPEQDRTEQQV